MRDKTYVAVQMLTDSTCAPRYAFPTDAGADLTASEDVVILPGGWAVVPTGFKMAIPEGIVGLVHPRSGLAAKDGVTVLNAPGTIDADYRGEVKVILINHGKQPYQVKRGDRIAQIVFQEFKTAHFYALTEQQFEETETARGAGGFGSTGVSNG